MKDIIGVLQGSLRPSWGFETQGGVFPKGPCKSAKPLGNGDARLHPRENRRGGRSSSWLCAGAPPAGLSLGARTGTRRGEPPAPPAR